MSVHIVLIDYYLFPLTRAKSVKWRVYKSGLSPILTLIESYRNILNIDVSLYITGGQFLHSLSYSLPITIYDNQPNKLQDFSGYYAGALNISSLESAHRESVTLFINTSCPPAYVRRCLDYLSSVYSTEILSYSYLSPSISFLFRYGKFWSFVPHIQSYCFMTDSSNLSPFLEFVDSSSELIFTNKKDFISKLELGFSSYLRSSFIPIFYLDNSLNVFNICDYISILSSNPFSLFDSRLNPFCNLQE